MSAWESMLSEERSGLLWFDIHWLIRYVAEVNSVELADEEKLNQNRDSRAYIQPSVLLRVYVLLLSAIDRADSIVCHRLT